MPRLSFRAPLALLIAAACTSTPAPTPTPAPTAVSGRRGAPPSGQDTSARPAAPSGRAGGPGGALAEPAPRPYRRVVTAEAKTRAGMFAVHQIGSRYLFEIPSDQFNKDELLVTEIAKTTLGVGYGGQAISNRVYRWERRDNRVYLRSISYEAIADSTTPEYQAVQSANVPAIISAFNVEAYGPDSSVVIDVTHLFTQPPVELSPGARIPGTVDAARSWIERATPFPDNVNVYSTLTYAQPNAGRGAAAAPGRGGFGQNGATNPSNTVVMSWSFHRLPDVPMMPRYCDDRVGYFSVRLTDYTDVGDKVQAKCFITRYRLEKKDPSKAVSDPVKPIVYYIDPATPKKWIPYFIKAIEDWQPAFEAAGFSHAIIGKVAPDDPDWSPEDARYSVVRWLPSSTENASGPNVHDPRSGEILNAHIQFYQNVQHLQLSWYFTQAAAVDARARMFPFPDSLMGRLLEYVLTHEVGHTIGFQHNMKASAEYPTDSLRSVTWLRKYGHTPTLMDYSRFNYLAQPEDNIPVELLTPVQGPYDIWATHWGYAPIPGATSPEAERATLDQWAREQDTVPWLRFSTAGSQGSDPGEETEAVGDQDAVKATGWGLKNLKREMQYVIPATTADRTQNYDELDVLYGRMVGQWRTELTHVTNVVGGVNSQDKYPSQAGVIFTPVGRARQVAAVKFLNENAFATPTWLLDQDILRRIEPTGSVNRIVTAQAGILSSLLSSARLTRMSENAASAKAGDGYSIPELLADVRVGLFSELRTGAAIDVYRRALQRSYVELLNAKLNPPPVNPAAAAARGGRGGAPQLDAKLSDVNPAVRADLVALDGSLKMGLARAPDAMTRAHIADLRHRIAEALKVKGGAE